MKLAVEQNYVAYSAISEGDIVAVDLSNSTAGVKYCAKATESNTKGIVGVAACDAAVGEAVSIHFFRDGEIVHVAAKETVALGNQLALDASGIVVNTPTSGELALPLVAMEAKTISSGTELVPALVCYIQAVNT